MHPLMTHLKIGNGEMTHTCWDEAHQLHQQYRRSLGGFKRGEFVIYGSSGRSPLEPHSWMMNYMLRDMETSLMAEQAFRRTYLRGYMPRQMGKATLNHDLLHAWVQGTRYHRPTLMALKIKEVLDLPIKPRSELDTYVDKLFNLRGHRPYLFHDWTYGDPEFTSDHQGDTMVIPGKGHGHVLKRPDPLAPRKPFLLIRG